MLHPNDYPVLPRQYRIIERNGQEMAAVMMPYPVTQPEDAACLNDPRYAEDLPSGRRGNITIPAMKATCESCPLLTACREWGIAHEKHWGMFGGLTPTERDAARAERGQVCVEPSAAHEYGMGDKPPFLGGFPPGVDNPAYKHGRRSRQPVDADVYASDLPWQEPSWLA